jgi:hypothetical protein
MSPRSSYDLASWTPTPLSSSVNLLLLCAPSWGCLLLFALITSIGAPHAHAQRYVRSTTLDGIEARWFTRCIPFYLSDRGSQRLTSAQVEEALLPAFDVWSAPECADLTTAFEGETSSGDVGYALEGVNENIIVFRFTASEWADPNSTIGLTTITLCQNDSEACLAGTIIDADIELNEATFTFTAPQELPVLMDLQSVLTHEVGHFLGFDHTSNMDSTMFPRATYGDSTFRGLNGGDEEGVCAVYPQAGPLSCIWSAFDLNGTLATTGAPSTGGTSGNAPPVASPPPAEEGCHQRTSTPPALFMLLSFLAFFKRSLSQVSEPRSRP